MAEWLRCATFHLSLTGRRAESHVFDLLHDEWQQGYFAGLGCIGPNFAPACGDADCLWKWTATILARQLPYEAEELIFKEARKSGEAAGRVARRRRTEDDVYHALCWEWQQGFAVGRGEQCRGSTLMAGRDDDYWLQMQGTPLILFGRLSASDEQAVLLQRIYVARMLVRRLCRQQRPRPWPTLKGQASSSAARYCTYVVARIHSMVL